MASAQCVHRWGKIEIAIDNLSIAKLKCNRFYWYFIYTVVFGIRFVQYHGSSENSTIDWPLQLLQIRFVESCWPTNRSYPNTRHEKIIPTEINQLCAFHLFCCCNVFSLLNFSLLVITFAKFIAQLKYAGIWIYPTPEWRMPQTNSLQNDIYFTGVFF